MNNSLDNLVVVVVVVTVVYAYDKFVDEQKLGWINFCFVVVVVVVTVVYAYDKFVDEQKLGWINFCFVVVVVHYVNVKFVMYKHPDDLIVVKINC